MEIKDGPIKVGFIAFRDIDVNIYFDKYSNDSNAQCCWQMRNPDSCYTGYMYMNKETGKMTYPDGAVIPMQTDSDKEMLPKFIIIGTETLTAEIKVNLYKYLTEEYKNRNIQII